jgi:lipopolysaccharide biosynthesis regulator YciM
MPVTHQPVVQQQAPFKPPDLMRALEQKATKKMTAAKRRRPAKKATLRNLYLEARRESHAARRKERSDLTGQANTKIKKAPRRQRKAMRDKLMGDIKARMKLFRETFPAYKKLKSKDHSTVRRLIENLKTFRLGLNI